ncbi:hypothetical protein [Latilactobacillus fuchuensis]|uniref:hypothetical protein n=1 Tax=Latilactobacillus fuchuensis TaxID=164393 RepID=UPI0039B08378
MTKLEIKSLGLTIELEGQDITIIGESKTEHLHFCCLDSANAWFASIAALIDVSKEFTI